ncbi:hypothetical protein [Arenimonas sp. MALMAid1274]|uniref:hypothetical protein n=1 Tax=Arenimonas sp. MALMAid1274 TaxID=3411630 RepID=UPI003BA2CF88
MTQPQDPRKHPHQDDELALARVLRALPAGEPSARLDAAILKAASDAVAADESQAPRPRRAIKPLRWLPSWAIGTAAAAVLAVGVGMQLRPPLAPVPQATLAEKTQDKPEAPDRLSVDLVEPEREIVPMPGPPPTQSSELRRVRPSPPPPPPAPAAVAPPPAPVPFPAAPPVVAPTMPAAPEEAGAFAPPPSADDADAYRLGATADEFAAAESSAPDAAGSGAAAAFARAQAEAENSQRRSEQRTRADALADQAADVDRAALAEPAPQSLQQAAAKARAAALPPVAEDARLAPAAWLDRVRERRSVGDAAGARASLRLFIRTYPDAPVPSDLARLR